MATLVNRTGEDSERSATKRCFSPSRSSKRDQLDAKRNRSRRRQVDPLLVMLQKSSLSREGQVELMRLRSNEGNNNNDHTRLQSSESDSDLIGSFGKTSDGDTVVEVDWRARRHDSLPTPTLAMVETDILGSLDSRSAEVGTPLDWLLSSSSSCLWSHTCSDYSCSSPSCNSCNSITSRSHAQSSCHSMEEARAQFSSCSRRASLGSFSSSYTSWTKPVMGRQQSDSCVPASSILDMAEEEGRSRRSLRLVLHHRQRDRSADTSKDISEIDDFELDILEDFELPHDDEDSRCKTAGWLVVSPDLAYSSMDPSHRSLANKPDS